MAIDTATPSSSVAVFHEDRLEGEVVLNISRHHTETLMGSIEYLLQSLSLDIHDMDFFAAVVGPGSFTGLRVGVATVKGLALAAGRPTVGVSALQMLAMQLPFCRLPVCAMLDARKKEVYAGLFDCAGEFPQLLHEEVVRPPERILAELDADTVFIGTGAEVYGELIKEVLGDQALFVPAFLNCPRASHAAVLALRDFKRGRAIPPEKLIPHYIRPSEAEIMWSKKQGKI
ncbi:MAG: tRNA (adenosine(37)-N6)-threonylcarbamoyltransferase complex dimerization subunit type 1 TsaB [Deltaproteobacteria bacterium]|nr:tRNA (adenosine(37)-N6)-threonylcarbamoyltransferase complex dimerization subunit type 1 TsaB [Deltaproteobacteria bacterium]